MDTKRKKGPKKEKVVIVVIVNQVKTAICPVLRTGSTKTPIWVKNLYFYGNTLLIMGLSLPGRNTDFDDLTEQSSDGENLDVVFRLLRKSQTPIWMPYHQLKIKNKDVNLP